MKIFCTGNPERKTIAHALNPDISASIRSGWDFKNADTVDRFGQEITQYNVFVNSAFIAPGIQETLMNTCYNSWVESDIRGHIINIGTTLENTNDNGNYAQSKRQLKQQSLKLSDNTGISGVKTSYIVLGGLGPGACTTDEVKQVILWILQQPYRVPLIQLDSVK
jgi:hypothetical protein